MSSTLLVTCSLFWMTIDERLWTPLRGLWVCSRLLISCRLKLYMWNLRDGPELGETWEVVFYKSYKDFYQLTSSFQMRTTSRIILPSKRAFWSCLALFWWPGASFEWLTMSDFKRSDEFVQDFWFLVGWNLISETWEVDQNWMEQYMRKNQWKGRLTRRSGTWF